MYKPQILVVEDEKIVSEDLNKSLRELGYSVYGNYVGSGDEALEIVEKIRPDIVMMDIQLQGRIDGIEAAKIIKERFEIPIIFSTAYADQSTLNRAKMTEPFGYMLKPYDEQELKAIIEITLYKIEITKQMKEYENIISKTIEDNSNRIIRYIEFPFEYQQAGLSILSYFGRILNIKYPNDSIKVRIEQENLIVRMIIETPQGKKDAYQQVLYDYGQVIQGKLAPEMLLSDSMHVLELKHKLELTVLDLKHTQELLDFQKKNYENRIESLEKKTKKLFSIIDENLKANQNLQNIMNSLIQKYESVKSISDALKTLSRNIKKVDITDKDRKDIEKAYKIVVSEPSLKDQIQDLILKGMISGPAGNFLTELMLSLKNLI